MTHLLLLLPHLVLAGQTEAPPPPPPSLKSEVGEEPPRSDVPTVAAKRSPADKPGPRVHLTINSNRADLQLWQRGIDEPFCTVPCNRLVPAGPDERYYLGGSGISPSSRFELDPALKAQRIDVRAGSRPAKIVGIVLTSVGIPVMLGGGLQLAWYGVQNIPEVQSAFARRGITQWLNPVSTLVTAIIQLAFGAGLLATGIPLWAANNTRMTLSPADPPAPPAPAKEPAARAEPSADTPPPETPPKTP